MADRHRHRMGGGACTTVGDDQDVPRDGRAGTRTGRRLASRVTFTPEPEQRRYRLANCHIGEFSEWNRAGSRCSLPAVRLVRPEGLEPPAYRFEACRSIQLSYGRTSAGDSVECSRPTPSRQSRPTACHIAQVRARDVPLKGDRPFNQVHVRRRLEEGCPCILTTRPAPHTTGPRRARLPRRAATSPWSQRTDTS